MISTKYLHLIVLAWMIVGWGAPLPVRADIALNGAEPPSHSSSASDSSADSTGEAPAETPTTQKTTHRKKRKSSETATAPASVAKTAGAKTAGPATGAKHGSSPTAETATAAGSVEKGTEPSGKGTSKTIAKTSKTSAPKAAVAKNARKKRQSKAGTAPAESETASTGQKPSTASPTVPSLPSSTNARAATAKINTSAQPIPKAEASPSAAATAGPKAELAKTSRKKRHGNGAVAIAPAAAPVRPPREIIAVTPSTGPLTPASPTVSVSPAVAPSATVSFGPTVQTGLPVARPGTGTTATLPTGLVSNGRQQHPRAGTTPTGTSTFPFIDYPMPAPRTATHTYPWKINIITTVFWIGEGGSSLSSTTNYQGAWNMEWIHDNSGTDDPDDEDGYASRSHASTLNPFYVALPFNDLVYPDKARRWIPASWFKPSHNGKAVSACQNRWVEIKRLGSGRVCFAQWEDVGPLRYDHAEYVFGPERPDTLTHAGLDVSPAVAKYLGIDRHGSALTSWRFVDDTDVVPGMWLKYDEQAIIFKALQEQQRRNPRIQDLSEPMQDQPSEDANQKKAGAARG